MNAVIEAGAPRLLALGLSTSGLQQWLVNNAVTVIVVIIGLACLIYSFRGEVSKVFSVIALVLCSLAVVAVGTMPGAAVGLSRFMAGLFGIGGQ